MTSDSHFFIVGAGRSGTTLLRSVLSAHSRMSVAPETHFMKRAEEEGLHEGGPRDFDRFWERLIDWVRFRDLGIDPQEARARIDAADGPTFRRVFDTMLRLYGERAEKPRIGEKTPSHTLYLDTLLDWFPDARVIAIQRDPRAVVASQLKTPWGRKQIRPRSLERGLFLHNRLNAVTFYAKDWAQYYGAVLPRWAQDPRVHRMRYETLVAHPEEEVRKLCAFLGETFEPRMLVDRSEARIPRPEGRMGDAVHDKWRARHIGQSASPITSSSLEKWRSELSTLEVGVIEARCSGPMREAGYELSSDMVSRGALDVAARMHNGLGRIEAAMHEKLAS